MTVQLRVVSTITVFCTLPKNWNKTCYLKTIFFFFFSFLNIFCFCFLSFPSRCLMHTRQASTQMQVKVWQRTSWTLGWLNSVRCSCWWRTVVNFSTSWMRVALSFWRYATLQQRSFGISIKIWVNIKSVRKKNWVMFSSWRKIPSCSQSYD